MPTIKDELLQKDVEAYFRADADLKAARKELTPEAASRAIIDFALAAREADKTMKDARFTELLREFGVMIRTQHLLTASEGAGDGNVVRAACRAGIVTDLEERGVGEMKPWQVSQLAIEIISLLNMSREVPKA